MGLVVYEIAKRLSDKFNVILLCEKVTRNPPVNVQLVEINSGPFYYLPIENREISRVLRGVDIIHVHDTIPYIWSAAKTRKPLVITSHAIPPWKIVEPEQKLKILMAKLLFGNAYRKADIVISVSECIQRWLKATYGISSVLIPNGVDSEKFKPIRNGKIDTLRKGDPMLLYVGGFRKHKAVDQLIAAMPEILERFPKAVLNIIGGMKASFERNLHRHVRRLKLEDSVMFLGFVRDDELPYYYNACDVFVTATRWEGFCLPMLEAMACGKPVVARDAYAMADHVRSSGAGEVFNGGSNELAQRIIKVLCSPEKYSRNARRYASQFSWEQNIAKTLTVYNSVLEK